MDASEPIISGDARCVTCGYNLRGLAFGVRCPECGRIATKLDLSAGLSPTRQLQVKLLKEWIAADATYLLALLGAFPCACVGVLPLAGVPWLLIAVFMLALSQVYLRRRDRAAGQLAPESEGPPLPTWTSDAIAALIVCGLASLVVVGNYIGWPDIGWLRAAGVAFC